MFSGYTWVGIIVLAVIIDYLFGDPFGSTHPVVLIGKLIGFLRDLLNRGGYRRLKGFVLVFTTLLLTSVVIITLEFIFRVNVYIYFIFNVWFLSTALAEKSLLEAGRRVENALEREDLEKARIYTGYIVGRDTDELSHGEIIRATVETIAENGVDGILAPLFYMFVGAVFGNYSTLFTPLLFAYLYKSINTMDSMIGYTDYPYTEFGYCAAKLDDLANYIPARIGSWYYLISGRILGYSFKRAYKIYKRDKNSHDSPNAGHPESAVAGLLGIRLGGDNIYFGNLHKKKTIGEKTRALAPDDISRTMRIVQVSELLLILTILIIAWILIASRQF